MNFNGRYFNNTSSTGYNATITLNTFDISIVYTDLAGNTKQIRWNTDLIHKYDFTANYPVKLTYGDYPHQYLEIDDNTIETALKTHYPNAAFHQKGNNHRYKGLVNLLIIGIVVLVVAVAVYVLAVPALAERLANTIPVSVEEDMGESSYKTMIAGEQIDEDKTRLLNSFFKTLHYNSNYPIRITVVKNNVVNAFALPGGRIVVYTGIINKMDKPEEMVALLSHEYSHVQLKHSTKAMCRTLSSYIVLSALAGDAGGITTALVQNADQLKQLSYTRSLEEEADREGMKLMEQNRIDLTGMRKLFNALKAEEKDNTVPGFLSTHPLTDKRIAAVTSQIQKRTFTPQPHPELDSLWQQIKGNHQW